MDREELLGYDSLARLRVQNFQSLKDIDIGFGRFTVFVGPSSSGKSAILRAVRAVVRNVSSPAAVSYGQSSFRVEAVFGDATISVDRGKGKSVYELDGVSFPKAGVSVPSVVEANLRMPLAGGQELSLADQFDRPFLLAEPGSVAAKVLGELTNASLLIEAAREANRRRQSFSRVAGLRAADVSSIRARLADSHQLLAEQERLVVVRKWTDRARNLDGEVSRLTSALETVQIAQQVADRVQREAREIPDVRPLLNRASALQAQRVFLDKALREVTEAGQRSSVMLTEAAEAQGEAEELRKQERDLLRRLGRCPFCGQSTEEAA